MSVRCWCQHCNTELPSSHIGPCPKCNKVGKKCEAISLVRIGIKATTSAEKTSVSYQWQNRTISDIVGTCIVDASIGFIGLINGLLIDSENEWYAIAGFLIGVIIGIVLTFILKRKVKEKVRTITKI
jgi:hypothetical protein